MWPLDLNLIIFLHLSLAVFGYNLSPYPNLVLKNPNIAEESSYFGYSVLLRENSVLVGAPRANVIEQSSVERPGTVFKCSFQNHSSCVHFPVDIKTNSYNAIRKQSSKWWKYGRKFIQSEFKNNSYLGATIVGGSKDDDSLLVCAPRFGTGKFEAGKNCGCSEIMGLQGICHWKPKGSNNFLDPFVMNNEDEQYARERGRGYVNHVHAQMGFSADIINDESFVMGAPGIRVSKGGSVVLRNNELRVLDDMQRKAWEDSYISYASAAGYLNGKNSEDVMIVQTSPRGSQHPKRRKGHGLAYIMTINGVVRDVFQSQQYGEYFGYSLAVEDVNNDQWDDVLIGAPLYEDQTNNDKNNCEDVGRVYIYENIGKDNSNISEAKFHSRLPFKTKIIKSPFGPKGRFGSSIAKLGDINLDGYNDVAIGAPHANGVGAVAIYLGGKDGLSTEPSEILKPSDDYRNGMFGFAISHGVDTDGNGYNDLAVGAPLIDTVFYFRSYPVVEIETSIRSLQEFIPLHAEQFEIEFCYRLLTQSKKLPTVPIQLKISLDSVLKRFALTETIFKRNADHNEKCEKLEARSSSSLVRNVLEAIPMLITVTLVNDAKNVTEVFCEDCAILENFVPIENKTFYNHGCGTNCNVDMSLEPNITGSITLGMMGVVSVGYTVKKTGDPAFNAKLHIETSTQLHFKQSQYCHPTETAIVCDLAQFEQQADQSLYVNVIYEYEASDFERINVLEVRARVSSAGNDTKPENNFANSIIELHRESTLELVGNQMQTSIELNDTASVYELEYSLVLTNSGPSKVQKAEIFITMPYLADDKTYVLHNDTYLMINDDKSDFEPIEQSSLEREANPATKNSASIQHEELLASISIETAKAKYQIVDCKTSPNVKCIQTRYALLQIPISEPVSMLIKYRFDGSHLKETKTEYWLSNLDAKLVVENGKYNKPHTTVKLNPIVIRYLLKRAWPIWIWIVSIVKSILVLGLLTWYLVKRGFFKRQSKEQMEERLLQKTEKQRMKDDLEKSLRKSYLEDPPLSDSMENVNEKI